MGVTTTLINKPFNPRAQDQSPKGYNRAKLYSGKALDFDGVNDKVNITTDSFDLYAVSFYFKGAIGTAANGTAFSSGTTNVNDGVTLGAFTGTLTNETITIGKDGNYTATNETFADGVHFICASWDATNSKYKIYVNGQEVDTFNNGSDAALNTGITAPALGYRKLLSDQYMEGGLSNVRAFSTALTAAQVADLYNNPEKVVPTGVDNTALKLWLPMMEGAGTTAYDGSGNGNHGTIAGATYVNGIGAPVAQSAVMDWNKGQNYVKQSENFDNSDWAKYTSFGGTLNRTSNYAEAPDGSQTATRIEAAFDPNQSPSYGLLSTDASTSTSGNYIGSLWLKSNTGSSQNISMYVRAGINGSDILVTNEWQRVTKQGSGVNNYLTFGTRNDIGSADANIDILVWGASINYGTEVDSYVPTYGSGQESDVLLPQGLTTGRDITGVNLFENVRKQGALNLDGNSWAEVHDNASVDLTDAITLEAWVYIDDNATQGRIFNKWGASGVDRSYQIFMNNAVVRFLIGDGTSQNGLNSATSLSVGNWHHIVGTYDSTNIKIYIDGSEDASVAETFSLVNSAETLYIGTYYNQTNTSVNPIAQPRIYNRALTAEEVQRSYDSGKTIYTNS